MPDVYVRHKVSHIMKNVIIKSCLIYKLNKERKYHTYIKETFNLSPRLTGNPRNI